MLTFTRGYSKQLWDFIRSLKTILWSFVEKLMQWNSNNKVCLKRSNTFWSRWIYPRFLRQGSNIRADPPAVLRWVWCMAYGCVGLFIPRNNLPIVYRNNKTIFCVWSGCQTKQNKWRTPGVRCCQACCELARFHICFGLAKSRATFSALRAHPSIRKPTKFSLISHSSSVPKPSLLPTQACHRCCLRCDAKQK